MVNPVLTPEIGIAALLTAQNAVFAAFKEGAAITFEIGEVAVHPLLVIATL